MPVQPLLQSQNAPLLQQQNNFSQFNKPPAQNNFYNPPANIASQPLAPTTQPYLFDPNQQQPPFYNNSNNNIPSSVRPPPTASEINASKQIPPTTIQNNPPISSQPSLANQFNNMNITSPLLQQQKPQQPPPPHFVSQLSKQGQTNQSINSFNQAPTPKNVNNKTQPHSVDLMREKRLIHEYSDLEEPIKPQFPHEFYTNVNCHPEYSFFYLILINLVFYID